MGSSNGSNVFFDDLLMKFPVPGKQCECLFFIGSHQRGVSDNFSKHDGGMASFFRHCEKISLLKNTDSYHDKFME